jgi:hypothetical protein
MFHLALQPVGNYEIASRKWSSQHQDCSLADKALKASRDNASDIPTQY